MSENREGRDSRAYHNAVYSTRWSRSREMGDLAGATFEMRIGKAMVPCNGPVIHDLVVKQPLNGREVRL